MNLFLSFFGAPCDFFFLKNFFLKNLRKLRHLRYALSSQFMTTDLVTVISTTDSIVLNFLSAESHVLFAIRHKSDTKIVVNLSRSMERSINSIQIRLEWNPNFFHSVASSSHVFVHWKLRNTVQILILKKIYYGFQNIAINR